jgi:hypothetical protein
LLILVLSSCHSIKPEFSFKVSSGGIMIGSSCYYLAQIREYRNPKGISRFPDGGQTKELRQLFGLFRTDTTDHCTVLAARFGDVSGWPVRYKTRLEKNGSDIAIGIVNINFPDSVDGIYLYSYKTGEIHKYSDVKALPALFKTDSLIAYCSGKTLSVEDYRDKKREEVFQLDVDPVFISWRDEGILLLFCSDPFRVMEFNLKTGTAVSSDLKYVTNYNQEVGASEISRIVKRASPDLRRILDSY